MQRPTPLRSAALVAMGLALLAACSDGSEAFQLGPEARLEISPSILSFEDVPRGGVAKRLVTVRHTGTGGVVRLDPIKLVTDSPDLSVGTIEKRSLAPGEETRIQIVYKSEHDEPDEGQLVIGHNLASSSKTEIPIKTPGQRATLVATPTAVDFGVVQAGAPKTIGVRLSNVGTAPAVLTGCEIVDDADADFACDVTAQTVIPETESRLVHVTYSPSGKDRDDAVLRVLTDREDVTVTVPLEGEEETPLLVVEPANVQFGWVAPGESRYVEVKLRNEGNADLVLSSFELVEAQPTVYLAGIDLGWVGTSELVLAPKDSITFGAYFQPIDDIPMTGVPLAKVVVRSNDAANDPATVPLFGAAGTPSIVFVPDDVIDFGYVAEGFVGKRTVTALNVGEQPMKVTAAQLSDATSSEFGFPDAGKLPATLNPGESVTLELTFENTEGTQGTEFARFTVNTSDPLVPAYPLDVVARRAQRPTCEPAFAPELLTFGGIKEGTEATRTLQLVNYGSGNCEYREVFVDGCLKVQAGVRHYFQCQSGFVTPFGLAEGPAFKQVLGPGGHLDFEVTFDAPEVENLILGRDSHFGRLAVMLHDPNTATAKYVAPPGGWMAGINLRGESAVPMLLVDPPEIDFGTVRTDCEGAAHLVTVTNPGPLEGTVTGFDAVGCEGEVKVYGAALPAKVPPFGTLYLEVRFAPTEGGERSCQLELETDAPLKNWDNQKQAVIPAVGKAIDVDHHVDVFEQVPPAKVDVLFIVDDSGSMSDKQHMLKNELPKLVQIATGWGQDYQLAVTTTDVEQTTGLRGRFKGFPPVAKTGDDPAVFAQNLIVGITGSGDEKGLEAAWLALTGGNVMETDITCVNAPGQCPEYGPGLYLWCLEGQCRGPNWGFLRDDAELVVIMVSDEEDSSPQSVAWYVSHLAALKKPGSGVGVRIHSVVETLDGCFTPWGSVGLRYIQAAEATGGHVASICADDFGAEFEAVAGKTFGLKDRFYPTYPVDPGSLVVRVDGQPCSEGWFWNESSGAVVFEEGGACFPDYGQNVELEYDVLCGGAPTPTGAQ